ncbi:SRPBCC domain-containing protein [Georgenia sp. 311]|uniref:SRPBCC domain-containing protein n=1 Tax=Georgenia wutianyii TaxID=2585135 RepID=A0ABX5VML7_9MICO|nr:MULTISPECIES: SRPBCC domain-containing protein [Georgenia]QDB79749.1 SRPBCC domain-containing protein [Georgenia wutianyii]TNC18534.1 SRPBCC domain-containing protein [Georgenia sp. 311]
MAEYRDSVEIAAPPETVFDYLVTEAGMTAWMGQHATLDPRAGGLFAVDVAGHPIRGRYVHVERPVRVVVSWGIAGSEELPPGTSTVEFRLVPTGAGTRVDLTHSGLPQAAVAGHADGWTHFLARIAVAAAGGDPGADRWRPLGEEP